ncbi:hypothetical protein chiPu_0028152, partial [Chiloscyllium punctatum]|nr:hypothetical protein [Chiloscyllium punctatum]
IGIDIGVGVYDGIDTGVGDKIGFGIGVRFNNDIDIGLVV